MATVSQAPTASGASYLFDAVQPQDILTREDMGEEERMMARALKDFAAQEVMPHADAIEARDWSVIGPLVEQLRSVADLRPAERDGVVEHVDRLVGERVRPVDLRVRRLQWSLRSAVA